MPVKITVVDYGLGNLFSVCQALEHVGAQPVLAHDPGEVAAAESILLPGVGAFRDGMRLLRERRLDSAIKMAVNNQAKLLGVCLGMQLLLDRSEEFGDTEGLGLIAGDVVAIPAGAALKVPHIGWNTLNNAAGAWEGTILDGLAPDTAMYFVHSFMAKPEHPSCRIADCRYGDTDIAAVIGRGRVWGTQFHPEKSGAAGLQVLKQFVERA